MSAAVRTTSGRSTPASLWLSRLAERAALWAALLGIAVVMLVPFAWLVTSSLKSELAIFSYPPQWIPRPALWQNYVEAWQTKPFGLYLWNSVVILALNLVAIIGSASLCAYGFARLNFPGRDLWFAIALATMMLPNVVLLVPSFVIFTRIGWGNTILPLTVPAFFGGGAFNIFLLRQFFRSLPRELADAARIDGSNEFGIYWRIIMPLAKPALATVAVFTFINSWNDFIGPLLYLSRDPTKYTVALGLALFRQAFIGRTRWDLVMAGSTLMILPVILVFFMAQRFFIQGIAVSGIKG